MTHILNYEELWNYFRDVMLKNYAKYLSESPTNKRIDPYGHQEYGIRLVIEQMEHPEAILPYLTKEVGE